MVVERLVDRVDGGILADHHDRRSVAQVARSEAGEFVKVEDLGRIVLAGFFQFVRNTMAARPCANHHLVAINGLLPLEVDLETPKVVGARQDRLRDVDYGRLANLASGFRQHRGVLLCPGHAVDERL